MNKESFDNDYTAPQVTEENLDSGGNYVVEPYGGDMGTLGASHVDPS
jgi:hypothetical protein